MEEDKVSLRSLLTGMFNSTNSKVSSFVNRFYKNDGPSVLVGIWAARLQNTRHFQTLVNAAVDIAIDRGQKELTQMAEIPELRHPANAIQLDKVENFTMAFIQQHYEESVPMILRIVTGLATANPLKEASSTIVREEILEKPWFIVYDNINFPNRKSDQWIDNTDTFENRTTATIVICDKFPHARSIVASYERLCFQDLTPGASSREHLKTVSKHILVDVLRRSYTTYQDCSISVPTLSPLPTSKTITYPLPSMHIDQSSTVGNLEVINTIIKD
ncbi:hypothetical protein BGZ82_003105, partial [Podila clonocystis]